MIGNIFCRWFARKVQPQQVQKADYKAIRENAYTAVNLLRGNKDSEMANAAYGRFLAEGKKAPGYASTILQTAKNEAFEKDTGRLVRYQLSDSEYSRRGQQMRIGLEIVSKRNAKAQAEFEQAGEKMYPFTWNARKRILPWYRDTKGHRHRTSDFKEFKRGVVEALQESRNNPDREPVSPHMQKLAESFAESHRREKALLKESLRKYGLD